MQGFAETCGGFLAGWLAYAVLVERLEGSCYAAPGPSQVVQSVSACLAEPRSVLEGCPVHTSCCLGMPASCTKWVLHASCVVHAWRVWHLVCHTCVLCGKEKKDNAGSALQEPVVVCWFCCSLRLLIEALALIFVALLSAATAGFGVFLCAFLSGGSLACVLLCAH